MRLYSGGAPGTVHSGRNNLERDMEQDTVTDLEEIKASILCELDGVEAIYLFGSVARGHPGASSDYDIAVVVKKNPDTYIQKISDIRYTLLGKIRRPVDIIILDHEDLAVASPIAYEIMQHNRLLFGRDILMQLPGTLRNVRPIVMDGATIGYHVGS
jgi:predicted nucleotidyltransferase